MLQGSPCLCVINPNPSRKIHVEREREVCTVKIVQYTHTQTRQTQSYQLAEPLWTDLGLKRGISVNELISTTTTTKSADRE